MPSCSVLRLCQYETNKLVRIRSVRLGSLKWSLNAAILLFICVMMLWNRKYQEFDLVVSSVTTKLKGVAQTRLPGVGEVVWDVVDFSGASQEKNSFFVVTNVIVTKNQKQGRCAEVPSKDRSPCRSDQDCEKGGWDLHSHGIQTGSCVKFDVLRKTCEVSAWCPIETKTSPPRPALLAAAENFTVLIKNNIRFPAFNFIRRNILPGMTADYLKSCNRGNDSLCPIFRLGDVVRSAGEKFSEMAVEGGVIGIQIKWDCNLDPLMHRCLPRYSFRRLDEKESNRTLYPGLNFRFAKYNQVNGVEERTLYKAFGIRFDVMVFGQAGQFSFIQLIVYVGSTLSYYALTTVLIDWLIGTSCYSAEVGQNYSQRKVEDVQDQQKVILCVSYVDENSLRLVKRSQRKSLQDVKPTSVLPRQEDPGHLRAVLCLLQPGTAQAPAQDQDQAQDQAQAQDQDQDQAPAQDQDQAQDQAQAPAQDQDQAPAQDQAQDQDQAQAQDQDHPLDRKADQNPRPSAPSWCKCDRCVPASLPQEQLCCRRSSGGCISSSPLFDRLVLRRPLLEAVLLYRDPLAPPEDRVRTAALRHCAYRQFISWRFGSPPAGCHPAVPSCCVRRIREEYPSPDGQYRGFRPVRTTATMQGSANGEL